MKKVKIWAWIVYGDSSRTVCLSKKEVDAENVGLGGWGKIKKVKRTAELAE